MRVLLALAQVPRVLELDLAQSVQRRHIPTGLGQHRIQPLPLLRGFDKAHPSRTRGEQQRAQRQRHGVMRHVRFTNRPAQQRFEVAARHIQLHRHRLVLDQRSNSAQQIKALFQGRAHLGPIRPARRNRHLGGGAVGSQTGLTHPGGDFGGKELGADAQRRQRRPSGQR